MSLEIVRAVEPGSSSYKDSAIEPTPVRNSRRERIRKVGRE